MNEILTYYLEKPVSLNSPPKTPMTGAKVESLSGILAFCLNFNKFKTTCMNLELFYAMLSLFQRTTVQIVN